MTSLAPLALVIGVCVGIGGTLWYLSRKKNKLINECLKFIKDNVDINAKSFNTLKSEGVDQPNKEGESIKEEPLRLPAPSPPLENKSQDKQDGNNST